MINRRPGQFIYSYDYKVDESWDDETISENVDLAELEYDRLNLFMNREDVQQEIAKTAEEVASMLDDNHIYFTLLSDTHYVKNGNWEYTASTIAAVNSKINELTGKNVAGIIHLGDFTDGILGPDICEIYSNKVISRLFKWGSPVAIALGNHDANYFHNNPNVLSEAAQWDMYLNNIQSHNSQYNVTTYMYDKALWYRVDYDQVGLCLLVMSAYKNDEVNRYGYSEDEIEWISKELNNIKTNYKVIILSHDAPLTELDYWANEIRNGEILCDILDEWNTQNNNRIIGFLHGHTHADYSCYKRSFPIVSIGCSKLEYYTDKKPEGAICNVRYEDEVSQELWDTLVVDIINGRMDFMRFGSGFNRYVLPDSTIDTVRVPKIWAHRGASGNAPENTIEAFKLAIEMGSDGIELDVQYTRDRRVVVIHDETIDRTSDGHGKVCDFTLTELRTFNFNKTHPEGYDRCLIPTLEEVLMLLKDTKLYLNIELKTGIELYPGIEYEVVNIVSQYGMTDRVIFSSFNHESLKRVKATSPNAKCGMLYRDGITNVVKYAVENRFDAIHPAVINMKYPNLIDECKNQGLNIHTWTVDSKEEIIRMLQYGVNAIITNYPKLARETYESLFQMDRENSKLSDSIDNVRRKNSVLHIAGLMYKYIRKPFVALDRMIQNAARKE